MILLSRMWRRWCRSIWWGRSWWRPGNGWIDRLFIFMAWLVLVLLLIDGHGISTANDRRWVIPSRLIVLSHHGSSGSSSQMCVTSWLKCRCRCYRITMCHCTIFTIAIYVLLVWRHIRKCVTQFGPKALFTPTNDCAGSHEKLKDRIHLYDLNGHGQYENDVFVLLFL